MQKPCSQERNEMVQKTVGNKVQPIKPEQMTSAGSNMPVADSVGNVTLDSEIESVTVDDVSESTQAAEIEIGIDVAKTAMEGSPVSGVLARAVRLLPNDATEAD